MNCVVNYVAPALICLLLLGFFKTVNAQATITATPKSVTLAEKETGSPELVKASCTPAVAGRSCSVDIQNIYPSHPCGNCFNILPCGARFCLRYLPGQGFFNPFIEPMYMVTLIATDQDGNQVRTVVDVHIMPNNPPYFDPATYPTMFKSFTLSRAGSVKVTATDPEGDTVTYSMTTVPDAKGIEIDSLSGDIRATQDLEFECRKSVSALVYAQDQYHSQAVGPLAVTLILQEYNDRPIINNLNTELHVREDTPIGDEVLTFAAYDGKKEPPTLSYTLTTVPTSASGLFNIVDNALVVGSTLDYETQPNDIQLTVQASDDYCDSDPYTLTVKLVDINEPPTILPIDQTVESCEGKVDIQPTWNASDPDKNDFVRFTNIQPNDFGRFKIDEKTGMVSTTIDYDLDVKKLSATVVSVVTVTDRQMETATATLTIRFRDCNDNPPVFDIPRKEYLVRDCWKADTALGVVQKATDADSNFNLNNVFSYAGSAPGIVVQSSGSIVITEQFALGRTETFPVYATDQGKEPGPLKSKAFWVSVHTLPCIVTNPDPPDTVTTTNATVIDVNVSGFWDSALAWVILAGLLAALLTALAIYMLVRYCWVRLRQCWAQRAYCCKTKPLPPRAVTPIRRPTPTPEKAGPGFIFGWWKEKYPDDDFKGQPERDAPPEPSKGPEPVDTNTYDVEPVLPPSPPPPAPEKKTCAIL